MALIRAHGQAGLIYTQERRVGRFYDLIPGRYTRLDKLSH